MSPAPAVEGVTSWKLFFEGDVLYEAMLEDVLGARTSILMESYLFAADAVGRRFAAALAAQAQRGCQVRLRVDYAGSRWQLDNGLVGELRAAGVKFEWARRWRWRKPWRFHRRNHRKLLVVDDATAYLGGFNIHAASSRAAAGESRWRDTHVRLTGPLACEARTIFRRGSDAARRLLVRPGGTWALQIDALGCRRILHREFAHALRAARSRIWLTTPYFVPDRRLRRLIRHAARRGVDVRILMPAKNDVPIVQWAARAMYASLLASGVRLFEYQPRVLHAKTLLIDDTWATVGSANFDYRSLFLNAEVNVVSREPEFCAALAAAFTEDLQMSDEIDAARWRARPWWSTWRQVIAWPLRRWL